MTVAASTKKFGINGNREGSLQQAGLGSVGFRKEDRKGGVLGEQMETLRSLAQGLVRSARFSPHLSSCASPETHKVSGSSCAQNILLRTVLEMWR